MIGQQFSHFRILDKIGAGGMGEVYRARDEQLEREVVLEIFPATSFPDPAARTAWLRAAQAAARLNHPHICTIHEVGEAEGQAHVAVELVDGRPLAARLAEGPLRLDDLLRYALQLTDAVGYAHERGAVHGDLQSSHIIVTPDGRVKVLGFGLARPLSPQQLTEATTAVRAPAAPGLASETPAYLAPEQLRGKMADARSDVWALGVLLHEMATGQRPFRGETTLELTSAILNGPARPLPAAMPGELQAVIERCLRKEPGQRYRRASEVHAALEAVQPETAQRRPKAARHAWPRRRRMAMAASAIVLVAAAAAVVIAVWSGALRLSSSPVATHALAVLPLANLSGDPNQQYLVDGLTNALIDDLSQIGGALHVISRTSTEGYATAPKPIPQIGRELGVDSIVEGWVAREGDRVRISAALIEAATGRRVWSNRYERNLTSILSLQADVARAVAQAIKGTLSAQEEQKLAPKKRDVNPQVWEAYQKGMFLLNQSTPDSISRGMDFLHQAIEKDPTDALAFAGLADGYITMAHGADPSPDALRRAKAAAQTALELDPAQPQAVFALGVIKGYDEWDWAGGERDLRRAIDLNPSFAMAHYHLAWFLAVQERLPEAIAEHIKARDADPLNPLMTAWLGELYRLDGEPEKAIAEARKALELNPRFTTSHFVMGLVYAEQAKWDLAIEAVGRAAESDPDWRWAVGAMCAAGGRTAQARQILAELNAQPVDPWGAVWRAVIHAALGEKDAAFEWASHQPHHPWVPAIFTREWEFWTKALVDDPRFEQLQRKMGVPSWKQKDQRGGRR